MSKNVNVDGEKRVNMIGRFLGGFVHPLIHAGYGAEFGLLGMWAEGERILFLSFQITLTLIIYLL